MTYMRDSPNVNLWTRTSTVDRRLTQEKGWFSMSEIMEELVTARETLAERIADYLAGEILSHKIRPGEQLVETELATRLRTSRAPIRDAFRLLELKGFVEVIPRKGTFVRKYTTKQIQDIYQMRASAATICQELGGMATGRSRPEYGRDWGLTGHQISQGRKWAMASIWDPIRIGKMELKIRFAVAPTVKNMSTEDGYVTAHQLKHYEVEAKGGPGLITTELAFPREDGQVFRKQLGLVRCAVNAEYGDRSGLDDLLTASCGGHHRFGCPDARHRSVPLPCRVSCDGCLRPLRHRAHIR